MAPHHQVDIGETPIRLNVRALAEGSFLAESPDVPGLVAQGRTVSETVEIAQDVARRIVESCLEHGDPLPAAFRRPRRSTFPLTAVVAVPNR